MKSKLNPTYIIVGLFLVKVGIFDHFRIFTQHPPSRVISAESAQISNLRPIR